MSSDQKKQKINDPETNKHIEELEEKFKTEKNQENIEEIQICIDLIRKGVTCTSITDEEDEQLDFLL